MTRYVTCIKFIVMLMYIMATAVSIGGNQLPIYWINMEEMVDRKTSMTQHLHDHGVKYHKRIKALTPQTCNLIMVDSNCNRVSLSDISIVCSHVSALHTALNDQSELARNSKYFIVLEDDVRFHFDVDYSKLIASAPTDFASLQLMMSHKIQIESTWSHYTSSVDSHSASTRPDYFIHRPRNSTVWSAQAVLYNKDKIRAFVERAVVRDSRGALGYKLVTTADYDKTSPANINTYKPAIACACLFADMFVYAMAQPSYISTVPFLNSAVQGVNSTYHQDHVVFHLQGFAKIQQIKEEMLNNRTLLPDFLSPLKTEVSLSGNLKGSHQGKEVPVDWVDIAKKNPAKGRHVPRRFNTD